MRRISVLHVAALLLVAAGCAMSNKSPSGAAALGAVTLFPDLAMAMAPTAAPAYAHGAMTFGPDLLQDAVINSGGVEQFFPLFAALLSGKCLNVVAIGGSVTAGKCHPDEHQDPAKVPSSATAWPVVLQGLLRALLPCVGNHSVLNLAVGGVGADYWLDRVSECIHEPRPGCAELRDAHLIIVDTSVNVLDARLLIPTGFDPAHPVEGEEQEYSMRRQFNELLFRTLQVRWGRHRPVFYLLLSPATPPRSF